MIAIALSQQIAALFLMMAAGFILVKVGVVKSEDSKPISTVIVYLIVPAVLIHAFQIEYTPEIRDGFLLSLGTVEDSGRNFWAKTAFWISFASMTVSIFLSAAS